MRVPSASPLSPEEDPASAYTEAGGCRDGPARGAAQRIPSVAQLAGQHSEVMSFDPENLPLSPFPVRKPALLLTLVLATSALVQFVVLWRGVQRARSLAAQGRRFERRVAAQGLAVLILGDSTGVGVGARQPEESIAGLLAADFPDADIVNVSESGARISTAVAQARSCNESGLHFDVAILHVGGNDIVRATPAARLVDECEALLRELRVLARSTVWLGPPNMGLAPLFPPPYSWVLAARSRAVTAIFAKSARHHDVAFVDFSAPAHATHFSRRRRQHFAVDGFHPSSSSYRYGYAAVRRAIGLAPDR
jgi:lysophospholipase L1-like esterase